MNLLLKIGKILLFFILLLVVVSAIMFGHKDIPVDELKAKYAPSPSSFISVQGMDVHYRDEGNARDSIPLVLIHGTGASLHTFDAWSKELETERRVIRMDLPAYGLTGPFPDRNYSIENYVEFISNFLNALEIKDCIIGGNSLGGQIAWNFTVDHPERVDKLILIDAAGYPFESESKPLAFKLATTPVLKNVLKFITPRSLVESSVKNVFADKTKVTEELVDRYFHLTLREGNRDAFVDRFAAKTESAAYADIKTIEQRTLILWGEKDELIPVQYAHQFQEDLPNDTLVVLKNVGHVPMEESPKESLSHVLDFLERG